MRKTFLSLLFFIFFLIFSFSKVLASGFQIKTIGALEMEGVTVDHIWYSNQNPTITGIAPANSDINITVDGVEQKVSADSSGNWIFHPNLSDGDHTLIFSNNESTLTKTLTIGNIPEDVGALPKAETPTVGNTVPTLTLFSLGIILLISAPFLYFKGKR